MCHLPSYLGRSQGFRVRLGWTVDAMDFSGLKGEVDEETAPAGMGIPQSSKVYVDLGIPHDETMMIRGPPTAIHTPSMYFY